MNRFRFHSYLDDGLFVVLIMAAAMASAALEVGAVLGAMPAADAQRLAKTEPSRAASRVAAGSSVDGALLSAAAPRSRRLAR